MKRLPTTSPRHESGFGSTNTAHCSTVGSCSSSALRSTLSSESCRDSALRRRRRRRQWQRRPPLQQRGKCLRRGRDFNSMARREWAALRPLQTRRPVISTEYCLPCQHTATFPTSTCAATTAAHHFPSTPCSSSNNNTRRFFASSDPLLISVPAAKSHFHAATSVSSTSAS